MRNTKLLRNCALACALLTSAAHGQNGKAADGDIHILPVQGNVYMLVGAGGNVAVQTGKDGVLVVDTGLAQNAQKLLAAIKTISDGPIRYVINTQHHPDHVGGNVTIRMAGSTIAGANVTGDLQDAAVGALLISHCNVFNRLGAPGAQAAVPPAGWPTSPFMTGQKKLWFNGEGVDILHQAAAHTDGDSIVSFKRSDVIATGDIFTTTDYPIIDLQGGGSIQGTIAALNKIISMIIPVFGQEGGTLVIPGHGRLCDLGDVVNFREMTVIIRDRIEDMVKKGMTLEQVKAAQLTQDYDPLYGSTGFWTTDKFVEAVYKSLSDKKSGAK
jgi:cyclase